MKFYFFPIAFLLTWGIFSRGSRPLISNQFEKSAQYNPVSTPEGELLFSFSFVGSNRVEKKDQSHSDVSTANRCVLKEIFNDVSGIVQPRPELLFLLGDLVLGKSDTSTLSKQLGAWVNLYNDREFSDISKSGVKVIAIPGNQEMLDEDNKPLPGATDVWMRNMGRFMPAKRDTLTGPDSRFNQMTYGFIHKNTGFILLNTDTYNLRDEAGYFPIYGVKKLITQYRENPDIEHIFVLGHRPYYIKNKKAVSKLPKGLPEGDVLWEECEKGDVVAYLSANIHDYAQYPSDTTSGVYQVIAGNGGSLLAGKNADYYGYSTVSVYADGSIQMLTRGFKASKNYYECFDSIPMISGQNVFLRN